jgi:methylamine---glutamate N-methyltransferase subunit B
MTAETHDIQQLFRQDPTNQQWRRLLYAQMTANPDVRMALPQPINALFPALNCAGRLVMAGDVGDYALCNLDQVDAIIRGNAGYAAGSGIRGGTLQVLGNAGDYCGAYGIGGTVIVKSDTGLRTAACMNGANVYVLGNVGDEAGFRMQSGALVIQGNCGERLGAELIGGVVYMLGEAKSIAPQLFEARMKEPDRLRLSLILARANLSSKAKEFRVFKPAV